MMEYRVKGLSCGHCAQTLEQEIQRLEHGDTARLSFNTGKLVVDSAVDLEQVSRILKSDGAFIADLPTLPARKPAMPSASEGVAEHGHAHGHSHERDHAHGDGHSDRLAHDHAHDQAHGHGSFVKLLLLSVVLYGAALLLAGTLNEYVLIGMYLAATAISGYTTFIRGLKNLFRLKFTIDTLMTVALIGAIAIGEWKEATLVAILFGVNEWLEGVGMERARRSMEALLKVAPKEALVIDGGAERVVPIAELAAGDVVLVRAGDKIPSDGTVADGRSSVDEAAITGESLPVDKAAGDAVYGGSVNNEGVLRVRIDKPYRDSSLAKILHLVEEAQETKTPTELFINKFARYYTPLIMAIAALVAIVPPLLGGDWSKWLYQGLAVLIVGCPCALILSSPIAIVSGIARNARNGILVKGGVYLEQLGKIDTLAFDKTGTLTKGEPHVERTVVYDDKRFFRIAGAMERSSSHPLAGAIMKAVGRTDVRLPEPNQVRTLAGSGMTADIEGETYWLGNEKAMAHLTLSGDEQATIDRLKDDGLTLVLVADRTRLLGIFGIADEIREESGSVVSALHRTGIRRTVMLTGDHQRTAEKVAAAVGVTSCHGNLLPEDKVDKIRELSRRHAVAMVGDGINDAPALAAASLGIAMGKGSDSAIETADIVLMQNHLGKLPEAIALSRRVNRIIRFNIAVSLGLKLLALLLTIPGWLTLWIAILSDMGATIFVTLVSLTVFIGAKRGLRKPASANVGRAVGS